MTMKSNREYRSMQTAPEISNDNGEMIVRGYASTFDEYKLFSMDGVDVYERILPEAFENTDMSDVIFVKNHEGTVFARGKHGHIKLSVDEHGLFTETDLSKTTASREMFEEIRAGMYDQMSFAFTVGSDAIVHEGDTKVIREIRSIDKIFDISAVNFPANPFTDISADTRSVLNGEIEKRVAERLQREEQRKLELAKLKYKYTNV